MSLGGLTRTGLTANETSVVWFGKRQRNSSAITSYRWHLLQSPALVAVVAFLLALPLSGYAAPFDSVHPKTSRISHVLHISVDALGGKYLAEFIANSPQDFGSFKRLIDEGASTLNARTDYTHTITLPNHTCMLTSRPVRTPDAWPQWAGHYWELNVEFPNTGSPESLHAANPFGTYIVSTFDVVHDNGLSTALYSGKTKFSLYTISYGPQFGASHPRGSNKIDYSILMEKIHESALQDLKLHTPAYAFIHYPEPDLAGHAFGYLGPEYRNSVKSVNDSLRDLLELIDTEQEWKNRTVIVLSADHGGAPGTKGHSRPDVFYNYAIPFIVWGHGIAQSADLYEMNRSSRVDPGDERPEYAPSGQPIRNGDGGNLSLKLLGLPAIPGSSINATQELQVSY